MARAIARTKPSTLSWRAWVGTRWRPMRASEGRKNSARSPPSSSEGRPRIQTWSSDGCSCGSGIVRSDRDGSIQGDSRVAVVGVEKAERGAEIVQQLAPGQHQRLTDAATSEEGLVEEAGEMRRSPVGHQRLGTDHSQVPVLQEPLRERVDRLRVHVPRTAGVQEDERANGPVLVLVR